MKRPILLALGLLLASAGCVPDGVTDFDFQALQPPAPPVELTGDALVGTASAGRFSVELFADRGGAHTGFNTLGIRVADAGAAVTNARLTIGATPLDGPATGAELPVEQPGTQANSDGVFKGSAFLLAPDTTARSFRLSVTVEPANGAAGVATFDVAARNDIWQQSPSDLLVSWVSPERPVVGQNVFEVAVHRWTGSAFQAVSGAGVTLYPYMDMGGGDGHSTPFTPPQSTGNGRYRSIVDFIMSGGWEMTVTLNRPDTQPAAAKFVGYTVFEP